MEISACRNTTPLPLDGAKITNKSLIRGVQNGRSLFLYPLSYIFTATIKAGQSHFEVINYKFRISDISEDFSEMSAKKKVKLS